MDAQPNDSVQPTSSTSKKTSSPTLATPAHLPVPFPSPPQPSPPGSYPLKHLDDFFTMDAAQEMLAMGLFPNAKEVTESVACWVALKRFVLPQFRAWDAMHPRAVPDLPPPAGKAEPARHDVVIVVGDGTKPRTAALISFMIGAGWKVVSVDPELVYDSAADRAWVADEKHGGSAKGCSASPLPYKAPLLQPPTTATPQHIRLWTSARGLTMVRARIQEVTFRVRRAVVVMMHAHVSLKDAVAGIYASEGVVGVVTAPCCSFDVVQDRCYGRLPDAEYVDTQLLSQKNTVRIWVQRPGSPEALCPFPAEAAAAAASSSSSSARAVAAGGEGGRGGGGEAAKKQKEEESSLPWFMFRDGQELAFPSFATDPPQGDGGRGKTGAEGGEAGLAVTSSSPLPPSSSSSSSISNAAVADVRDSAHAVGTLKPNERKEGRRKRAKQKEDAYLAECGGNALIPRWLKVNETVTAARNGLIHRIMRVWPRILASGTAGFSGTQDGGVLPVDNSFNAAAASAAMGMGLSSSIPVVPPSHQPVEVFLCPRDASTVLKLLALRKGKKPVRLCVWNPSAAASSSSSSASSSSSPSPPHASSPPHGGQFHIIDIHPGSRIISLGAVRIVRSLKAVLFAELADLPGLDPDFDSVATLPPSPSSSPSSRPCPPTAEEVGCDLVVRTFPALLQQRYTDLLAKRPANLQLALLRLAALGEETCGEAFRALCPFLENHAHDDCTAGRDRTHDVMGAPPAQMWRAKVWPTSGGSDAPPGRAARQHLIEREEARAAKAAEAGEEAAVALRAEDELGLLQLCIARPPPTPQAAERALAKRIEKQAAKAAMGGKREGAGEGGGDGGEGGSAFLAPDIDCPTRLVPGAAAWLPGVRVGDAVAVSGLVGKGFSQRGNVLLYVTHAELAFDSLMRVARPERRHVEVVR